MDGVEDRHGVFVMGASNRPDMIDQALLRPGRSVLSILLISLLVSLHSPNLNYFRLTKTLFVDLPSPQGRVDILKKLTKNGTKPRLHQDVDLTTIGLMEGYICFVKVSLRNTLENCFIL